jgi:hypothetical protein
MATAQNENPNNAILRDLPEADYAPKRRYEPHPSPSAERGYRRRLASGLAPDMAETKKVTVHCVWQRLNHEKPICLKVLLFFSDLASLLLLV